MFDFLKTVYNIIKPITEKFNMEPTYSVNAPILTNVENILKDEKWCLPVIIWKITSPYGWRILNGQKQWHPGIDLTGKNKYAKVPCDCIITGVRLPDHEFPERFKYDFQTQKWIEILGIPEGRCNTPYVKIENTYDHSIVLIFRHIELFKDFQAGSILKCGENFCTLGNFGYSQGIHAHIEIYLNGKESNPEEFFKSKNLI